MLTAGMQNVLETCPDPDEPGLADASCSSDRNSSSSSKNASKGNKKAGQGVAKPGPKDRSSNTTTTAGGGGKEKKGEVVEEEEEEDELTLCIVCMTEKRNACLVHGKTSHQVRSMDIYMHEACMVRGEGPAKGGRARPYLPYGLPKGSFLSQRLLFVRSYSGVYSYVCKDVDTVRELVLMVYHRCNDMNYV